MMGRHQGDAALATLIKRLEFSNISAGSEVHYVSTKATSWKISLSDLKYLRIVPDLLLEHRRVQSVCR